MFRSSTVASHNMASSNLTVKERYAHAIRSFESIESSNKRADSSEFQTQVHEAIQDLQELQKVVYNLSLFSDNEKLEEVNTTYLPFAATTYYLGLLHLRVFATEGSTSSNIPRLKNQVRRKHLQVAQSYFVDFLYQLSLWSGVLPNEVSTRMASWDNPRRPTSSELTAPSENPASRRARKIAIFRLEKQLRSQLDSLQLRPVPKERHYDVWEFENSGSLDEEIVRLTYVDQLKLFSILAFNELESIASELLVLEDYQENTASAPEINSVIDKVTDDGTGYTTRLEKNPLKAPKISELIGEQGKILQPFVVTANKQDLKKKVFGTGQVLPSMSIEEYLDYELANGKMLKSNTQPDGTASESDSDDEMEMRQWDDWKDENPRGSGNMKANIG